MRKGSKCSKICGLFDLDSIFSYSTVKIVKIRDFRLGVINLCIKLAIVLYFLIYVLIIDQQYQQKETAFGEALTKVKGASPKTVKLGNGTTYETFDDAYDIIYPPTENDALFLTTKVEFTSFQTVGSCQYPGVKCDYPDNSKCDGMDGTERISFKHGSCQPNGYCLYPELWCPVEDPKNNLNLSNTEIWMYDVRNFTIWVKSSIVFPQLDKNNVYSTIQKKKPVFRKEDPKMYNILYFHEIMDDIDAQWNEIFYEIGAIIQLSVNWKCNLNWWKKFKDRCSVTYQAQRMDDPTSKTGFNFRRTEFHLDNKDSNTLYRHEWKYYGMRIVLSSKGYAYKASLFYIILQFSSLCALLVLATTVTDFLVNYIITKYKQFKYEGHYRVHKKNDGDHGRDDEVNDVEEDGEHKETTPLISINMGKNHQEEETFIEKNV